MSTAAAVVVAVIALWCIGIAVAGEPSIPVEPTTTQYAARPVFEVQP